MIYGYARISTDGQSVDAQVKRLRGAGAAKVCAARRPAAREPDGRNALLKKNVELIESVE